MMKFPLILLLVLPLSYAADTKFVERRHERFFKQALKKAKYGRLLCYTLRLTSFLGNSSAGFVFKGVTSENNTSVVIKIFDPNHKSAAEREYAIYSHLNAINDTKVERYGIPTMHYYGFWKCHYVIIAYTELEKTLLDHINSDSGPYPDYDILFLIRHFIKQSKYIHSRGIRHNDINLQNIATRGCESFLIGFDHATKMAEDDHGGAYPFASLRHHQWIERVATDDWESFLYTICYFAGITFDWNERDLMKGTENDEEAASKLYGELKANRKRILDVIHQSNREILKPILLAFAKESFSDKQIPDYDVVDRLVTGALKTYFPNEICFSWITRQIGDGTSSAHKSLSQEKIKESIEKANTNIRDLPIPKKFWAYENFAYPNFMKNDFQIMEWSSGSASASESGPDSDSASESESE